MFTYHILNGDDISSCGAFVFFLSFFSSWDCENNFLWMDSKNDLGCFFSEFNHGCQGKTFFLLFITKFLAVFTT